MQTRSPARSIIPNKKRMLASLLSWAGALEIARAGGRNRLIVFNFHRIAPGPQGTWSTPFDAGTYGPDAESFRKELQAMKRFADPVSEAELVAFAEGRAKLPRHGFMVTFDDGYRDNYELALPILKELGIPAIFFIPTEAIDERKLGWWDQIHYLVKKSTRSEIQLGGRRLELGPCRLAAAEACVQEMSSRPASGHESTEAFLRELSLACGVELPGPELCSAELMTWEQVLDAQRQGITIGAHTHTHRVLSTLSLDDQREELRSSKRMLEAKLGTPVRSLAYPVGGYEHFNPETKTLAQEEGFDLAFSFNTGINCVVPPSLFDRFDVRRLSGLGEPVLYAGVMSWPELFAAKPALAGPVPRAQAAPGLTAGRIQTLPSASLELKGVSHGS